MTKHALGPMSSISLRLQAKDLQGSCFWWRERPDSDGCQCMAVSLRSPSSYSVAKVRLLLPFVRLSGVVAGEGRPVYGRRHYQSIMLPGWARLRYSRMSPRAVFP
jgi:hypothetical protein